MIIGWIVYHESGLAGESRGLVDAPEVSNSAETAGMSDSEGAKTYLGVGATKHVIYVTHGVGSYMDVSSGYMDVPSIQMDTIMTANETEVVSIPQMKPKLPDSPTEVARMAPDKPNGLGNHADRSNVHTDVKSGRNRREVAANISKPTLMVSRADST